ncbi:unnamed protein product [Ectocarpus sp. 6 AP-2014]
MRIACTRQTHKRWNLAHRPEPQQTTPLTLSVTCRAQNCYAHTSSAAISPVWRENIPPYATHTGGWSRVMGGGGDGGKVLGHVGRTTSHNHGVAGGGHRPHSSRHGGHHASASQGGGGGGGSTSADHAGPPDHQGGSHASKAGGGGGSRNTAAAGGGGGGGGGGAGGAGAAWRGDLAGKSKSSTAIAAPALPSLAKPGGSGTRAPQTQSWDALGGGGGGGEGGGGMLGAVCMLMVRLLSCGRRGAKLAPMDVTLDEETEELVELLQVSKAHLAKLRGIFESIDVAKTGTVFCYEVLSAVDAAQSPFTDNLFRLVAGVHPEGSVSFCQLCRILMTYCVFSKEDILLFLFRQYDTDNSGAIDEREFRELAKTVNNASPMFPGNFAKALLDFDTNSDGQIDFEEFRAMDKAFPLLFFPAFRLQDSLQKFFLGSTFWVKAQEGVLARQGVAEYQATHGGRAPDKRGRQGR